MTHQTVSHSGEQRGRGPLVDCSQDALVPPGGEPRCPVDVALAALGGRWTPLVLRELLLRGDASFTELARALPPLSDKVLSDRLSTLVDAGVVNRRRSAGFPPRVRYVVTDRGRGLERVLDALWEWGSDAST